MNENAPSRERFLEVKERVELMMPYEMLKRREARVMLDAVDELVEVIEDALQSEETEELYTVYEKYRSK